MDTKTFHHHPVMEDWARLGTMSLRAAKKRGKKLKMEFEGHAKASSFNSLSTKSHYELACNALDRIDTVVEQERRTNKLLSTCTETVSIRLPLAAERESAEK